MTYAIDIETIPGDKVADYIALKKYHAPANIKDPEKIAANIEEQKEKDAMKAALYWWTARVVCICCIDTKTQEKFIFMDVDEKKMLKEFFLFCRNEHHFVAQNYSFDIPFIIGRAMALDIGVPLNIRPYGWQNLNDVSFIFGRYSSDSQRSSLADYCFGLGLDPKLGEGTDVATWWNWAILGQDEYFDKIEEYCSWDTMIVAIMWERFLKLPYPIEEPPIQIDENAMFGGRNV